MVNQEIVLNLKLVLKKDVNFIYQAFNADT